MNSPYSKARTVFQLANIIEQVHKLRGADPIKSGSPKIDTKEGILQQFRDLNFSKDNTIFYLDRSQELDKQNVREDGMMEIRISIDRVRVDEEGDLLK